MDSRDVTQTDATGKLVIVDKDISCYAEIEKANVGYQIKIVKIEKTGNVEIGIQNIVDNNANFFKITRDYSIYYLSRAVDGGIHLYGVRNGRLLLDLPIPREIEDFYISPEHGFVAIKVPRFPQVRVFTNRGEYVADFEGTGLSFFSEKEWYVQSLLGLSRLTYDSNQLVVKGEITHFDVDPTGRLIATYNANVLFSPVDIHDTVSKKMYSKVVDGALLGMQFVSNKRIIIVTEDSVLGVALTIYDFEERKIIYKRKISESERIYFGKDKILVFSEPGHEIVWFSDFEMSYQWQIENSNQKKITITGEELLDLASDAVKKTLGSVTQKNLHDGGVYRIQKNTDWLRTVGHLSTYLTQLDRKSDFSLTEIGIYFQIAKNGPGVEIKKTSTGDARVVFPNGDDYRAFKSELHALTDEPPMSADDVARMIESNFTWRPSGDEKHKKLANVLLKRITAADYPKEIDEETRKFLDCLLVQMVGVESSRNNITFLTSVMLLDLIEAGVKFPGTGRSYGFDNAFVSRLTFSWKNKIALSEIELIRDWLNALFAGSPEIFQESDDVNALKEKVKGKFLERMQAAYVKSNRPCGFLQKAIYPSYSISPHMQQHFEREKSFYYLAHSADDDLRLKKLDSHYHRVDVPCETMPGYVIRGESKTLTEQRKTVTAELIVKDKIPNKLVRKNVSYDKMREKIQNNDVSKPFKKRCLALLRDYNQWLLTYYDGESVEKSLRPHLLMHVYDHRNYLFPEICKRLKWTLTAKENESVVTAENLKGIISEIATSTRIPFLARTITAEMYHPDYLGEVLNKIRDMIVPQFVEMSMMEQPDELQLRTLRILANRHAIFEDAAQPWVEFLTELQGKRWVFNYKIGFSFTKVEGHDLYPCPSCYSQAVDFPVLPYLHNKVLAFSSEQSGLYHRFDSDCSAIGQSTDGGREKADIAFPLKFERAGKKPCECCWIVPRPTLAPFVSFHHATVFSPVAERKRSRSSSLDDREDQKRARQDQGSPRPPQ